MTTAEHIRKLADEGRPRTDIAASTGLSLQSVHDYLSGRTSRPGLLGRPPSVPLVKIKRARAAVTRKRAPMTKKDAARKYGIGLRTLWRYLEPGSHPLEK